MNPQSEFERILADESQPGGEQAALVYLQRCNGIAQREDFSPHPFDSPAGAQLLERWLANRGEEQIASAYAASLSLRFVRQRSIGRLLVLAMEHPDDSVRLEGAWAAAEHGIEAGIDYLATCCLDPLQSDAAVDRLRRLRREDAVPRQVLEGDFMAMVRMYRHLVQSQVAERAPDEIELYDTRTLYWPPTNDHRQVWLFKFHAPAAPGGAEQAGIGMVGSETAALLGQTSADWPPEDIYAMHCCWELQSGKDPRAPAELSVEAGRRIMSQNQDRG